VVEVYIRYHRNKVGASRIPPSAVLATSLAQLPIGAAEATAPALPASG
jgi:hypothetical protein